MTLWAAPIRAVAFDMDGLMVNTEELYTEVGAALLDRRGRAFSANLKRSMMGLPSLDALGVMIELEGLDDLADALLRESEELFEQLLPDRIGTLPGLEPLLDQLDRRALPRCVATSSNRALAGRILNLVDLSDRFDCVVTADCVARGKPAPDIYLEAARRMGIAPENMLVLEDSQNGARAGVAAGACTIAVPGEHSHDHDFSGVCYRAASLADPIIATLIDGQCGPRRGAWDRG